MSDQLDDIDPNGPGPEPGPTKGEDWARLAQLRDSLRKQLGAHEEWIAEEFEMIEKELGWIRSRLLTPRNKQPVIWFMHAKEVLDAVGSGVVSRQEARKILGIKGRGLPRMPTRRRSR